MTRELYWLVILEAACFFSFPAWELASLTFPLQNPRQFCVDLLVASVVATLVFHVGPAFFVRRLDRFAVPAIVVQAARVFLALYCLEWLARSIAAINLLLSPWLQIPALLVAIVILAQDWWRRLATASLGLILTMLTAWLWIDWPGLWTDASFTIATSPEDFRQSVFTKVFLTMASVTVVAGWIGRVAQYPAAIWKSALFGATIPLILSLATAWVAAGAGATLYYRPTLPMTFTWAMAGLTEEEFAIVAVCVGFGLVSPVLVSSWSLGALFRPASSARKRWAFGVVHPHHRRPQLVSTQRPARRAAGDRVSIPAIGNQSSVRGLHRRGCRRPS